MPVHWGIEKMHCFRDFRDLLPSSEPQLKDLVRHCRWICGNQDPCQRPKTKSSKHALEVERWSTQDRYISFSISQQSHNTTTISGEMHNNNNWWDCIKHQHPKLATSGPRVLSAWHWYAILSAHAQLRRHDCCPSGHRCFWWAVQQPLAKVMVRGFFDEQKLINKRDLLVTKYKKCIKTVQGQTSESSSAMSSQTIAEHFRPWDFRAVADHPTSLQMALQSTILPR